jgi:signal transduction histidine kinase
MNEFTQRFAEVVRLPVPRRVACDVKALLEDVARLMREECAKRAIAWRWEIETDLGPLSMDPAQMELVLINIIKNALEAIETAASGPAGAGRDADAPRGTVTVRIARLRGRASVGVRDTGAGISPEVQDNLFTPFYSTKSDGQGIGLTLVQEILLAHGFDFALHGIPQGGAEFVIYF